MFSWPQKIRVLETFTLNSHSTITGKRGRVEEFIITAAFIPKTRFGCFWQVVLEWSWQEADRLHEFPFKRSFCFLRKTHDWTIYCELQMCVPSLLLCPPRVSTAPGLKRGMNFQCREGVGFDAANTSSCLSLRLSVPVHRAITRIGVRQTQLLTHCQVHKQLLLRCSY